MQWRDLNYVLASWSQPDPDLLLPMFAVNQQVEDFSESISFFPQTKICFLSFFFLKEKLEQCGSIQ